MTRKTHFGWWPVVIGGLLAFRYLSPPLFPGAFLYAVSGGLLAGVVLLLWWLFFGGRPWSERLGAVALAAAGLAGAQRLLHVSMATAGQGFLYFIFAVPLLSLAFLVWAVAARRLEGGARWASMAATLLLACGVWTLLRTGGITGDGRSDLAWRWSETPEEQLLAREGDVPVAPLPAPAVEELEADWPGFRGPRRDGVVSGVRIETDWTKAPPVELWRRPIGPGWSSFAVAVDLVYTQEQRGEEEIVACYDAATGEPVWQHADRVRFYESNGGPGPRGTPTLRDGRVYAFGATGILNVLDAGDGSVVWSRDAGADSETAVPGWGFASSPLVVGDTVLVAAAGTLVAYDRATGDLRWVGPSGGGGYSSPHRVTIDGVEHVVLASNAGVTGFDPADGTVLWQHAWDEGARIVQPGVTEEGDLLVSAGETRGMRRLSVALGPGGFRVEERWTSIRLKPYFNDFVVHEGHAYGFDGRILAAIDVATGERRWKGGRYGHGQLVLLPEQDVLLVISEDGELALVSATPERFQELARFPAIEGKTWNHLVLVGDRLFVRNGQEMAAFRLAPPST